MHKLIGHFAASVLLLMVVFASSCQSDDMNFVYPIEPEILSVEVSPLQVQEFSDSLRFAISTVMVMETLGGLKEIRYRFTSKTYAYPMPIGFLLVHKRL